MGLFGCTIAQEYGQSLQRRKSLARTACSTTFILTMPSYYSERQTSTPVSIIHSSQCPRQARIGPIAPAPSVVYPLPAMLSLKSKALSQTRSRFVFTVVSMNLSILINFAETTRTEPFISTCLSRAKRATSEGTRGANYPMATKAPVVVSLILGTVQ